MPQRKHRGKKRASGTRPAKPYPEFPLTAHPTGLWCKAINGKTWYFGPWARRQNGKLIRLPDDGWQDALNRYIEQRDELYAGRTPRVITSDVTVADLCEQFLSTKSNLLNKGEIVPRTFSDYRKITERLIGFFGKRRRVEELTAADCEELSKRLNRMSLRRLSWLRSMFWSPLFKVAEVSRIERSSCIRTWDSDRK